MEDRKLIAEIHKNSQETIRVMTYRWKGQDLIDTRMWIMKDPANPESAIPTKKGLTIRPESLPELILILQKADKEYNQNKESSA